MGKINNGRVLLGGLLAGLVINIIEFVVHQVILGEQWHEAVAALNLQPWSRVEWVVWAVIMFLVGIFIVWLYAAIRPRYGAGPKTAVCAGLAVWFSCFLLGWGGAVYTVLPCNLVGIAVIVGLVEAVLAALAGGWVYKEEEAKEEVKEEPAAPSGPPEPPEPAGPTEPPGTI